jgi:thymidylate synthase (FAD)
MSTDKGFKGWGQWICARCEGLYPQAQTCECGGHVEYKQGDEKLLRFLYEHKHMTPFEMAGLIIEVQAPIFVFREWHRHRTQSYNEMSGRYTQLPDLYYIPSVERLQASRQDLKNKQGSESGFSPEEATDLQQGLELTYRKTREVYEELLARGVAREVARMVLPVAQYSRMRASANLRNWLAFLTLRMDPAAQWEIREYANAVASVIEKLFPRTYQLFTEGNG